MEAAKGNKENRKIGVEFAVRRKEPQPSLLALKRKIDELKNEMVKFDAAQESLMEKGSEKLSNEEKANYVMDYEEVGEWLHDDLNIVL